MMRFDIITIFPEILDSYLNESLMKRARSEKIIDVRVHNLRKWSNNRHGKVDDRPFGGGPGMVLQVGPIYRAVRSIIKSKSKKQRSKTSKTRVILFSTRGKAFNAAAAKRLARYDQLIFICGRYEGVDERVAKHVADEEISLGPYVLSGGELPALIVAEAVARFRPGFLGKTESLEEKSGSHPAYTRPPIFEPKRGAKWPAPEVLRSGDHKKIAAWRRRT
ncbi:MAG: tRNA (guanosine(37)-N1)-methyltransferase TrmD [Patescibacteria group bacterium]